MTEQKGHHCLIRLCPQNMSWSSFERFLLEFREDDSMKVWSDLRLDLSWRIARFWLTKQRHGP